MVIGYWVVSLLLSPVLDGTCPDTPRAVRLGSLTGVKQRLFLLPISWTVQGRLHCSTNSTRNGDIVTLPLETCPKSDWESVRAVTSTINTHCTDGVDDWLKSDGELVTGLRGVPIVVRGDDILRSVQVNAENEHAVVHTHFSRGLQRTVPSSEDDLWVVLSIPDLAARQIVVYVRLFYYLAHPVGESIFDAADASTYMTTSLVLGQPYETATSVVRTLEVDRNRRMVHIQPRIPVRDIALDIQQGRHTLPVSRANRRSGVNRRKRRR